MRATSRFPADAMYSMMGARSVSTYASPSTVQRTLAGRVRDFVSTSKAMVDIALENERQDNIYTTMDKLQGSVNVTTGQTVKVDTIEIYFIGQSFTLVERLGAAMHSARNEAHHQFLKLVQPIPESLYPENNTFEPGQTYKYPFTFCVPEHLLLTACRHTTSSQKLKEAHLQLPPTLNDMDAIPQNTKGPDDLTPDMVRISYGIRVRLLQQRDGKEVLIAEKHKKVRIVPAAEEQPPVTIDEKDDEYCLRKDKSVRKGMFKSKLGRVVMEAAQPRSFALSPADLFSDVRPTVMARINLRFDPAEPSSQPPRLGSLTSKIKATTFFSTSVMREYPSKTNLIYDPTRAQHTESISLSSRNVASVQWQRQEPHTSPSSIMLRRDSAASITATTDCPQPSEAFSPNSPFWVAELLVPISLPSEKFFVPTFHCCLVSRVYILEMQLSVPSQSGAKGVPTTLTLRVPVQVSADRVHEAASPTFAFARTMNEEMMAYYEAQVQQAVEEGEDYFLPRRSIVPPPDEFVGTSVLNGRTMSVPIIPSMRRPRITPAGGIIHESGSDDDDESEESRTSPVQRRNTTAGDEQEDDLPPDYSQHQFSRGRVAVAG